MLYRHFPEIANVDFPVLTVELSLDSPAGIAEDIFQLALSQGATLFSLHGLPQGNTQAILTERLRQIQRFAALTPALRLAEHAALLYTCPFVIRTAEDCDRAASQMRTELEATTWRGRLLLLFEVPDTAALNGLSRAGFNSLVQLPAGLMSAVHCGFYTGASVSREHFHKALTVFPRWSFFGYSGNYRHIEAEFCLAEAARATLCGIALDPFASGTLEHPPVSVRTLFSNAPVPRIPSEWALKYLWERQELISVRVQPHSTLNIMEYAAFAQGARANCLTRAELEILRQAGDFYRTNP